MSLLKVIAKLKALKRLFEIIKKNNSVPDRTKLSKAYRHKALIADIFGGDKDAILQQCSHTYAKSSIILALLPFRALGAKSFRSFWVNSAAERLPTINEAYSVYEDGTEITRKDYN